MVLMRREVSALIALAATAIIWLPEARSEEADTSPPQAGPLAPFARLVGGQWWLGESYQEFEWGVGRRSVRARSYFIVDGTPRLVSEGSWFRHPGRQQIRGFFTAIDMPVALFEYTTRFEQDRMVSELRAFDPDGGETRYLEILTFTSESQFVWKLFRPTPDGLEEEMGGTYTRR